MNDKQVAIYIKSQEDKITAWKSDFQESFKSGKSKEFMNNVEQRIKTIESSLGDFRLALKNG